MRYFDYYHITSQFYYVWCVRIFSHSFRLRLDKSNKKWRLTFKHYKLCNLDLLPLYYEVGLIKYQNNKDNQNGNT